MNEATKYRRHLLVPPDDVNAAHEFLQNIWAENPHIPSRVQISFETAIVELVANIILYSVASSGVRCDVFIEIGDGQIDATISDNGDLVEMALEEHIMPDEFSESGRGIPLMRALVDELSFDTSQNQNAWRMSKRFQR